jgi:acetyl esterase
MILQGAPMPKSLTRYSNARIDKMRVDYRSMIPQAGTPDPIAQVRSTSITSSSPDRQIPVRLYYPLVDVDTPLPIIIFTHGGGFVSGDLDTHEVLIHGLAARTGALVVSMEYRLAPENPFPAGIEDVYATLVWAHQQAAEIGADCDRIAVAGDSAGGSLTASLTILSRDRRGPKIIAQLLMFPVLNSDNMNTMSWLQLGETHFPTRSVNEMVVAAYVPPGMNTLDPRIAPLNAELADLPPALLLVGELDPLRDDSTAYAAKLNSAGVEAHAIVYAGARHGFMQFYKSQPDRSGVDALDAAAFFLRGKLLAREQ